MAQIAYLTQDLIEHIHNANNLLARSKYELARIQQTTQLLATVHEELEKDWDYVQNFK